MGLVTAPTVKKFEFQKSKMANNCHFYKPLNRHISATVRPILMKFGRMMHIGPQKLTYKLNF